MKFFRFNDHDQKQTKKKIEYVAKLPYQFLFGFWYLSSILKEINHNHCNGVYRKRVKLIEFSVGLAKRYFNIASDSMTSTFDHTKYIFKELLTSEL